MKLQITCVRCSSLSTLDAGSRQKIPENAMQPAYCMVFLPHNLSTGNGQIRYTAEAAVSFLAWIPYCVLLYNTLHNPFYLVLCLHSFSLLYSA